ncbi:hypothetical protein UF75_4634 [Desulfosporosinus sp. I2]|nr:hypothetical protein UF75_4634 [Desulfosporosinus sp. I2]
MFALDKIPEPQEENTQANRIRILKREGLLPKGITDILYAIRKSRSDSVALHIGIELCGKSTHY